MKTKNFNFQKKILILFSAKKSSQEKRSLYIQLPFLLFCFFIFYLFFCFLIFMLCVEYHAFYDMAALNSDLPR